MDLLRELLFNLEKLPSDGRFHDVAIHGHTDEEITYDVMLLDEVGFIRNVHVSDNDGIRWKSNSLTHSGREFIDAARSGVVWEIAKNWTLKKAGTLTVEELRRSLLHIGKAVRASRAEKHQKADAGTV